MAVSKKSKTTKAVVDTPVSVTEKSQSSQKKSGFWDTVGWSLLLVGGLAHMLPEQMAPVLKLAAYGLNLQVVVGSLSVIVALYYLLGDQ